MKKRDIYQLLNRTVSIAILVLVLSCVEEFDAEIQDFESILVVDARLTDEVGVQSINLSRTFEFDSVPAPERNAQVSLVSGNGTTFPFSEGGSGVYQSTSSLQLVAGESYQLEITTQDGIQYRSDFERLPEPIAIGEMQAIRRINNTGLEGVAIVLDNAPNSAQPEFFRYEFEETYKIIAPDFHPFEWDEVDYDFFCEDDDGWEATVAPRTEEARICYASNRSLDLILASTADLASSGLEDYEVRFLGRDNYFISHRYSILVKQFHHSSDANSFFSSLLDFSGFDSVFSNVQTGLLEGNIRAENSNASVLGYFELSSYSEKRIFFDYADLFPDEPLPPYAISCELIGKPPLYPEGFHVTPIDGKLVIDGTSSSPLLDGIIAGLIAYVGDNENYQVVGPDGEPDRAPFLIKATGCVDCREFGSNVVPEFWEE